MTPWLVLRNCFKRCPFTPVQIFIRGGLTFSSIDLELMASYPNMLVPPEFPLIRAYPPHAVSQEKPPLIPLGDPATVTSRQSTLTLTMSESTLRSSALVPPKLSLSIPIGVQQVRNFSSTSVHCPKSFTLLTALQYPSILAQFIAYVDWPDLYHVLCTCQHVRDLFRDTGLREVILTRYVVGYGYCLRNRDLNHFQDMQISIFDLDLLCKSLSGRIMMTNSLILQ